MQERLKAILIVALCDTLCTIQCTTVHAVNKTERDAEVRAGFLSSFYSKVKCNITLPTAKLLNVPKLHSSFD